MNSKYWTIFMFMGLVWGSSLAQTTFPSTEGLSAQIQTLEHLPLRNANAAICCYPLELPQTANAEGQGAIHSCSAGKVFLDGQETTHRISIRGAKPGEPLYYISGVPLFETPITQTQVKTTPIAAALKTEQPILITKIYPNPTSEALQVKLEEEVDCLLLSTSAGQVVKNFGPLAAGTSALQLPTLPAGQYYLKAIRADAQSIHPILITQ